MNNTDRLRSIDSIRTLIKEFHGTGLEKGCYSKIPFIVPYSIKNDARLYDGPYPVIAHPPCQRWGKMAVANYARWGGEHNKLGNDNGCFESALKSVETFGGVIEHPAYTYAYDFFN